MTTPRGIVIVAMGEEAEPFLERASRVSDAETVGGSEHRDIVVDGLDIVLVQSGIGFVNAAGAATAAILRRAVAAVGEPGDAGPAGREPVMISAGTAGGTGPRVRVGDVVVGSDYVNLDADARVFGYVYGQVPRMPASYAGDETLVRRALAFQPGHAPGEAPQEASSDRPVETWRTHSGLIASSYSFMTPEKVATSFEYFPAIVATDMESIAIAQTCHVHGVPFVSVRGISDLADADDHESNAPLAAAHSADVTLHLLAGI